MMIRGRNMYKKKTKEKAKKEGRQNKTSDKVDFIFLLIIMSLKY
jgi:hypothetical protein